ncbi:Rbl2p KNAG_0G02760 [Huiozyma naganishii CBS 8797]|uniref:Tubulin-specific chaperone A n=1 Tax=Huiozyma naganishii (strain ATCC MYA-139 / BCRC 22969 / CBS 8797 / KCTC 17520 / NBRC 10181 / NCYC 3082 / Yp74L-3) TaxID=1071383 RepID=J7S178_HUIN7|nr:hypothetical protein KNAG_0G02760 [Kazachstania naganishii CBS 8797]CCK71332.1 hypothetical protein KNAG_0G02760 [Kazachstania naganishii CBS 8797]
MAPTQLEIKVKALQRLVKEHSYYQQELKDQKSHVDAMQKDPQVDSYDLKKQVEVLQDTERLLPTLYKKIGEFKENLEQYVASYDGSEPTEEAKQATTKATELLASVKN